MILLLSDWGQSNFYNCHIAPVLIVQLSDLCRLLFCDSHTCANLDFYNLYTCANYDFTIVIIAPIMILQLSDLGQL